MSPKWIFAGGFQTDSVAGDPLADLGGVTAARPQVGDTVKFGGKSFRFAAVPEDNDKGFWHHENYDGGKKLIDITNAVGRDYFSTNFFYSVTKNDKLRWVRFDAGLHDSAVLYLNGVRLAHNEVARIEPGLHPMLVQAYIDQINPWGRQIMRPRLVEITADEAELLVADGRSEHERAVTRWQERKEEWKDLGKIDLECRDLFERSRHMMYLFCREAVGDGGFQAELAHYSAIAEKGPARCMGAYLQMFGNRVSPQQDMEQLLARKMFAHVYPDDNGPRALEINGSPSVGNDLFAALLPVVRKDWQPSMLWGWQRQVGFEGDDWAVGSTDRNRHRWEESVVQLPDDPHNHNACATVTYADTRRDGSGVISIDYADVYRGRRLRPDGRKGMRMYSRYGNIRQDEAFVDLGITGMRSIGVDYSGRSGAPCLVAIVDRVHGGGRKIWTWQLPKGSKEAPSDVQRTTVKGNSFTVLKADGASLHGIFVSGQRPVAEVRMTTMTGGGGSTSGKTLERPIHGVFAETRNKKADCFFVGTIQPGQPPEIRFSGQGLNTLVTVDSQQIWFDGEKIGFESKH